MQTLLKIMTNTRYVRGSVEATPFADLYTKNARTSNKTALPFCSQQHYLVDATAHALAKARLEAILSYMDPTPRSSVLRISALVQPSHPLFPSAARSCSGGRGQ